MADHALREQAGEGLIRAQMSGVMHGARVKPRIEQMQNGVLNAANILVDGHPVIGRCAVGGRVRVKAGKAGIIPAAVNKRVECICFARRVAAAFRASRVLPRGVAVERIARRVEADIFGQGDGQVGARHRNGAAIGAMDHRDRATPVALARNAPIAQPEVHLPRAAPLLDKLCDDLLARRGGAQPVKIA